MSHRCCAASFDARHGSSWSMSGATVCRSLLPPRDCQGLTACNSKAISREVVEPDRREGSVQNDVAERDRVVLDAVIIRPHDLGDPVSAAAIDLPDTLGVVDQMDLVPVIEGRGFESSVFHVSLHWYGMYRDGHPEDARFATFSSCCSAS